MARRGASVVWFAGTISSPMPLSRSPGEPFGVHGQHALAFQPDPAAARKIVQRLLVPHAAASDHLGDLLVREIVHHTDRAVLLAAELLRQLQQLLGGLWVDRLSTRAAQIGYGAITDNSPNVCDASSTVLQILTARLSLAAPDWVAALDPRGLHQRFLEFRRRLTHFSPPLRGLGCYLVLPPVGSHVP